MTSTVTEQVSAETTTASSSNITSSEAVYTVTATGATVTVTVTNSGSLPNITTTAVPPYPVGNSTCSHATSGAYTNPTSAEAMCITITDSSTVATECFTVLPIVSSVTGEVLTPSQTANATVLSTSSSHNNSGMFTSFKHFTTSTNIGHKSYECAYHFCNFCLQQLLQRRTDPNSPATQPQLPLGRRFASSSSPKRSDSRRRRACSAILQQAVM